jgi:nitroimidazol reductase NimA-like FMN-containing flavoprotein (pyridoxamine 5'-phosphate oxidase superfamily)
MPKNLQQVKSFMDKQWLASFSTVDRKNAPHVVPVFFTYDDGKVYVQTGRKSVKVRNVSKNSNASVAVYSREEAVIVRGKASIISDPTEFKTRTQEHIAKYKLRLDEQGRDSLGIPLFNDTIRCVVELTPKRTLFW